MAMRYLAIWALVLPDGLGRDPIRADIAVRDGRFAERVLGSPFARIAGGIGK
jgi:N-acyl-D-aspartate/D-glutamate deacylase